MGEITKEEMKEINNVVGWRYFYTRSRAQPAHIFGWDKGMLLAWAFGAGYAGFAKFIKGYSIVWLIGPFVPLWTYLLYNWARQPTQEIENAYRFLINKRAATAAFEKNNQRFKEAVADYSDEINQLKHHLTKKNQTLYDLEAEVYSKMHDGTFK